MNEEMIEFARAAIVEAGKLTIHQVTAMVANHFNAHGQIDGAAICAAGIEMDGDGYSIRMSGDMFEYSEIVEVEPEEIEA